MSPKLKKNSEAESFLIRQPGVKTPTSLGSMTASNRGFRYNIAVMGDKGSGKTSLI